MNIFTLQGQLLYSEKPKREGGSALAIIGIGKEKDENNNLIQSVNKVIVRIPGRLSHVMERFAEDDYIEITGTAVGRVHRAFGSNVPVSTLNLVASGIQVCSVSHLVKPGQIPGKLFGNFTMSGLIKAVKAPKKEGLPHTLFLQIERPIGRNDEEQSQPTAVIPITVFDRNVHKLEKLEAQMSVVVTGDIRGVLRKMPIPEVQDEFEERLEVGLLLGHIQQCAIIPTKVFESRKERAERELREKHEGSKEAEIDLADADVGELPDDATA